MEQSRSFCRAWARALLCSIAVLFWSGTGHASEVEITLGAAPEPLPVVRLLVPKPEPAPDSLASLDRLSLTLRDVVVQGDGITGLRVFLSASRGLSDTAGPESEPIGSAAFFPTPVPDATGRAAVGTYVVTLDAPAVVAALAAGRLCLRVVPIGATGGRIGFAAASLLLRDAR
ncbi:hypothetical protein [Puniceibacterium confluentis]|uniref:hypothetical protein n=1 Tax=Puniceibacterium confluentis TaxID=1958944 RepID=UPI0011B54EAA|nr:hypothetical protein [Puniceibacterium confluentis]